jgi:hypothetical protein
MDTVKVAGLRDLTRELRKLDDAGLIDELKDANMAVAELVVRSAQQRAAGMGRMENRAAQSLKPARQANRAAVHGGGPKTPFFGGAEFGAGQNQQRSTPHGVVTGWNQFEPWRGNGQGAGYFLYPAIRDDTAKIVDMYGDAIERITAKAFPD